MSGGSISNHELTTHRIGLGLSEQVNEALAHPNDSDDIIQLGLGLLIVQRIVSGHGWELSPRNSPDGTTFEITSVNVTLPIHKERIDGRDP